VKPSSGKRHRIRLGADAYHRLHQEILKRDGWRCVTVRTRPCGQVWVESVHEAAEVDTSVRIQGALISSVKRSSASAL